MPGYGAGGFLIAITAVCGGCERRQPLTASNIISATAELVKHGWGEHPDWGLICRKCTAKVAKQMADKAREEREAAEAEETPKIILPE